VVLCRSFDGLGLGDAHGRTGRAEVARGLAGDRQMSRAGCTLLRLTLNSEHPTHYPTFRKRVFENSFEDWLAQSFSKNYQFHLGLSGITNLCRVPGKGR
jgi:hypothetical protein